MFVKVEIAYCGVVHFYILFPHSFVSPNTMGLKPIISCNNILSVIILNFTRFSNSI